MDNEIYKTPESNLIDEVNNTQGDLATRGSRFGAAFIDGIIGMVFNIPFMLFVGPMFGFEFGQQAQPGIVYSIAAIVLGLAFFSIVHGYFLHSNGQTIGKIALKIKIVDLNSNLVPFPKLIGLRYLPISLSALIPIIGPFLPLAEVLFIFRSDRRCIHDLIAGTKVIQCNT